MSQNLTSKGLIYLAVPAALSAMLNNAYRVIDQHAVQWLGVDAQAAIASCGFVLIAYFSFYSIISGGAIALVARAKGADDEELQKQLLGNSLTGALGIGVVVLTISAWMVPITVDFLGLRGSLAEQAEIYLRWHALFCLPQTLMPTLDAIFIAYGRTKTVLLLQVTASLFNIVLNPLFIYDFHYGIGGAALATGVSQGIAVLLGLLLLFRIAKPGLRDLRPNAAVINIARIGLPMCWGTLLYAGVYWALLRFVISPLGASVNAALGIGFSVLEGFTWPVFWGFSMAIASLIGRCLGAGEIAGAKRVVQMAFKLLTFAGLAAACIFWLAGATLCGFFTEDPRVFQEAVLYAHVLAFSQLFVAYEALTEGVLNGAGDTKTILLWSAPFNLLRIPLAWLFAIYYGYGAIAVWWVINTTTMLKVLGKGYAVCSGRWQRMAG